MLRSPCAIVGYETHSLTNGQLAFGAQFISIGTNGCWLSELKPVISAATSRGEVTIQTLDKVGKSSGQYVYQKNGVAPYNKGEGWYKGINIIKADVNDVFFPAGQGLWVKGKNTIQFTSSGEVLTRGIEIPLIAGQQLLANPYPTGIKLSSISLTGLPATSRGQITIQTLDTVGKSSGQYVYQKNGVAPYNKGEGWYKGINIIKADVNDVTFPAGQGLWVKGIEGVSINFVKPF